MLASTESSDVFGGAVSDPETVTWEDLARIVIWLRAMEMNGPHCKALKTTVMNPGEVIRVV